MALAGGGRVFDARRRRMAAITIVALLAFQGLEGGLSADVSLPMTACVAALLLWQGARRGGGAALTQTPLLVALELMFAGMILVLIGSVLPGVASSLDPSASIVEIILLLGLACAFTLGMMAGASDPVALFAVKLFVVGGAVFAGWALLDFSPLGDPGGRATRLSASYLAPNTAGAVFAALVVLAVFVLFRRLRAAATGEARLRAGLWSAPVLILGAALLATASRGAGLACLAGLGVMLAPQIRHGAKDARARRALILVGLVVLALVAALGGALLVRLSADPAPANVRGELVATHWKLFLAHPVRGYGLGTFDLVNRTNLTASTFGALWSMRAAHNLYLQWLEEAGLIAAALMAGCLAIVLGVTVRGVTVRGVTVRGATVRGAAAWPAAAGLLWGLLGVDAVFLLHGCGDFALQTPSVAILWSFLLGLQFALARQPSVEGAAAFRRAPPQGGLATGIAVIAIVAWLALRCGGALRIGPAEILPLAAGFDRQASRLVETSDSPAALDAAQIASARALSLAPYDTSAALRLAYIDQRRNGRLTPAGEDRLRRSYDRVALDQGVALWRIRFALENWSEVKPTTRTLVRREFEALLSTGRHRRALLNMLAEVRSPAGRMVARFWASKVSLTN